MAYAHVRACARMQTSQHVHMRVRCAFLCVRQRVLARMHSRESPEFIFFIDSVLILSSTDFIVKEKRGMICIPKAMPAGLTTGVPTDMPIGMPSIMPIVQNKSISKLS